jgi:pyridoxal phosphate enzyme (YggS family)
VPIQPLQTVLQNIANVAGHAGRPTPRLLAVSKRQPATAIAELAARMRSVPASADEQPPAFGENYVQEARAKIADLEDLGLEWHLIGHLQSNKAAEAAGLFDWVQTVDRPSILQALARHRPPGKPPLNVLVQVNVDDETTKHGCAPEDALGLAAAVVATPNLTLRGLMAIPEPRADIEQRRPAFRRMKALFDTLHARFPDIDTLSMGTSEDFGVAIEEGATMVRLGTALFGPRPAREPRA